MQKSGLKYIPIGRVKRRQTSWPDRARGGQTGGRGVWYPVVRMAFGSWFRTGPDDAWRRSPVIEKKGNPCQMGLLRGF